MVSALLSALRSLGIFTAISFLEWTENQALLDFGVHISKNAKTSGPSALNTLPGLQVNRWVVRWNTVFAYVTCYLLQALYRD